MADLAAAELSPLQRTLCVNAVRPSLDAAQLPLIAGDWK